MCFVVDDNDEFLVERNWPRFLVPSILYPCQKLHKYGAAFPVVCANVENCEVCLYFWNNAEPIPFGECVAIFARYESQSDSFNLPHIHGIMQVKKQDTLYTYQYTSPATCQGLGLVNTVSAASRIIPFITNNTYAKNLTRRYVLTKTDTMNSHKRNGMYADTSHKRKNGKYAFTKSMKNISLTHTLKVHDYPHQVTFR